MKRFLLLLAAFAGLLITGCNKNNQDDSLILGSWKGYSRSRTILKNGEPVSPATYLNDMIKLGLMEEPEDAITMLAERADVNLVQIIGRNGLLFKRNYEKPKIELP